MDGNTDTQFEPSHFFSGQGTYNVALTATDSQSGNSSTSTVQVIVADNPVGPTITENGGTLYSNYPSGNQWYDDNGLISGATGDSYTPPTTGNYYVIYTDPNGCVSPSSAVYPVLITDSDLEEESNDGFSLNVYPNPCSNCNLQIEMNEVGNDELWISLIDASGRLVRCEHHLSVPKSGAYKSQFSTAGMSNGAYRLVVSTAASMVVTTVVISE